MSGEVKRLGDAAKRFRCCPFIPKIGVELKLSRRGGGGRGETKMHGPESERQKTKTSNSHQVDDSKKIKERKKDSIKLVKRGNVK
ncbi:hypothetical protein CEXT_207981 [Caerostris extrusa]|uniref:Uncharacterized protein n=1 Tax=Caerostris extrusa TaxID=172846 RepID=A0AAV4TTR7_CAEEX|nr:hypothetical protein CEXT_207981 [Caerostris extrusa]